MILYSQNSLRVASYREHSEASGASCTSVCFPNERLRGPQAQGWMLQKFQEGAPTASLSMPDRKTKQDSTKNNPKHCLHSHFMGVSPTNQTQIRPRIFLQSNAGFDFTECSVKGGIVGHKRQEYNDRIIQGI